MIINKITTGFVVQTYDTETGKWIGQDFIAVDEVGYEDQYGDFVNPPDDLPYLPFTNISLTE